MRLNATLGKSEALKRVQSFLILFRTTAPFDIPHQKTFEAFQNLEGLLSFQFPFATGLNLYP